MSRTTDSQPTVRNEETARRRRKAGAFGLASLILVAGVAGVVATSGAYFTDRVVTTGNSLTAATIKLGSTGDTTSGGSVVTATNILPMAPADIASKAVSTTVNIRNIGTAALDWDASLTNILVTSSGSPADSLTQVKAQVSRDGGTTWDTATTLSALKALSDASTPQITSLSSLASAGTTTVKIRLWLDALTGNTYQGLAISFGITARAIQAGTPIGTAGVVFP